MANVNAFLQSIVKSAKLVCFEKFNLAKTAFGPDNAELNAVKPDMDRIFLALDKQDFWNSTKPIDTDGTIIATQVIALDNVQPPQFNEVAAKIRSILTLLDTSVIKAAAKPLALSIVTSGMNIRILNALRITRQKINIRLQKFVDAGQDLTQDEAFKVMQIRQENLVKTYREQLTANQINGKEEDVEIIQLLGNNHAMAATSTIFKVHYNKLNNFIQAELPRV